MQRTDLVKLAEMNLAGRWVAIDMKGGSGLRSLPSGAVLVDHDTELDALCLRVAEAGRKSLTIFQCERRPESPTARA
jgi:hypothetical protein